MTRLLAALTLALLAACGGPTAQELKDQSQDALKKGDYAQAIKLSTEGLALPGVSQNKADAWHFERVRLESLAGQGKAQDVLNSLAQLSATYGEQLKADFYAKLGKAVYDAGQTAAAIDLVEAGKQKFPDRTKDFDGLVADIIAKAAATNDDAAMAKLKALGYL